MVISKSSSLLVDTGYRAIKFNKIYGVRSEIHREGFHLMVPWIERPIIYDVKTHPTVIKSVTGSKGTISSSLKIYRFADGEY